MNIPIRASSWLGEAAVCLALAAMSTRPPLAFSAARTETSATRKPNIVVLLADQWRAQAFGFAGDRNVKTPNLDRMERQSVNFINALSSVPGRPRNVSIPTEAPFLSPLLGPPQKACGGIHFQLLYFARLAALSLLIFRMSGTTVLLCGFPCVLRPSATYFSSSLVSRATTSGCCACRLICSPMSLLMS